MAHSLLKKYGFYTAPEEATKMLKKQIVKAEA